MLKDGLSGERCEFAITVGLIERADLEPRSLGTTERLFEFSLVTKTQKHEMGMIEIGCAKRSRLKCGMGSLHSDLCGRKITTNKDVNVTLAG